MFTSTSHWRLLHPLRPFPQQQGVVNLSKLRRWMTTTSPSIAYSVYSHLPFISWSHLLAPQPEDIPSRRDMGLAWSRNPYITFLYIKLYTTADPIQNMLLARSWHAKFVRMEMQTFANGFSIHWCTSGNWQTSDHSRYKHFIWNICFSPPDISENKPGWNNEITYLLLTHPFNCQDDQTKEEQLKNHLARMASHHKILVWKPEV
jgi:hypothetical protein